MTRLLRLPGGRLLRLDLLPPAVTVRRRWDGTDQAHPVTLLAQVTRSFRLFGDAMRSLGDPRYRR